MSEKVSQLFKDWMIATGKTANTASSYCSGVNAISRHCGLDVYEVTDLSDLEYLYQQYGPKGEFADIGASTQNTGNVQNGLKQWLDYQRIVQTDEGLSIDPLDGRKQWDLFLARWPLEKLRELTLEQYYSSKEGDSFYSWLRDRTSGLGDFKEGILSAGVRLRGPNSNGVPGSGMQTDGQYLWYSMLGNSAQEAFKQLKAELLTAVDAVQKGDLNLMSALKNAPGALVWKVAFLYQEQAYPLVLPFYTTRRLKWVAGVEASGSRRALQQHLMGQRNAQDLLEFAAELERRAMKGKPAQAEKEPFSMDKSSIALNQILFGPPGTGKTYATIEAALEVLDSSFVQDNRQDREALKQRFDQLSDEGRIRFVTFHQSFSYEDFVEGLRAENDEATGQLRYEVVDGVFKNLCEVASAKVTQQAEAPLELAGRKIWKMSLGNTLGSDASIYEECVQGGYMLLGYGEGIDFSGCKNRSDVQSRFADAGITLAGNNDYSLTSVSTFVTKMQVGDLVVVSDGNFKFRAIGEIAGDYAYNPHADYEESYAQMRPVKWLRQYSPSLPHGELLNAQFSQMTLYELRSPTLNREKLQALLGASALAASDGVFSPGQIFGRDYQVVRASADLLELKKPNGNLLGLSLSLLNELAGAVRLGKISLQDIRDKNAIDKLPGTTLEPYLVNGYNNILAPLVEHLLRDAVSQKVAERCSDARVLIIDEINRGNISRIFGELITLIEASKRADADEALSVVLPYSKQRFSVPSNVHLIGTMNTTDRSLAGLDIALRRRFVFKEMLPDHQLLKGVLVAGIDIGELLQVMNQRIEVLLDRDHCLGHAYFMSLKSGDPLARLESIFRDHILPLLQEYFFEDWQRIQWVLNDHRKPKADRFVEHSQPDLNSLFGSSVTGVQGGIWRVMPDAFKRVSAYAGIIAAKSELHIVAADNDAIAESEG